MDSCELQKVLLIINSVFHLSSGFLTPWWYCDSLWFLFWISLYSGVCYLYPCWGLCM